jgi:formiminoglutamase
MKRYPIAFVSPHAGLEVPPELDGRLALTPAQIFNEADANVDQLYDFADRALFFTSFPIARAIIDVNRPVDPALHHRPGDSAVKRITSYGDPVYLPGREPDAALEKSLVARYWQPWHVQLAAIADDPRLKLVIDCHSMAAVGPATYDDPMTLRPRVAVANQGDENGELRPQWGRISAPPELARFLAQELGARFADIQPYTAVGAPMAINTPFYGGWDLFTHGGKLQPWLMIELNRALYVGDQSGSSPVRPLDPARKALLTDRLWQSIFALMEIMEIR